MATLRKEKIFRNSFYIFIFNTKTAAIVYDVRHRRNNVFLRGNDLAGGGEERKKCLNDFEAIRDFSFVFFFACSTSSPYEDELPDYKKLASA